MTEMWGDPADAPSASDWELPGDAEIQQRLEQQAQPADTAAVEAPAETQEQPEGEAQPERQRNEKGQFVSAQPTDAEPETEAEQAERLFAGKYKTADDLERAHEELQRKLGEQGGELGQMRQYLEQLAAAQQQQAQRYQQPQPQVDWDSMLEDDPTAAADLARQQNNEYAYQQALRAMDENLFPGAARLYQRTAYAEHLANQARQEQQQALAPVQQMTAAQARNEAIHRFHQENPWFQEVSDEAIIAEAERNPSVMQALISNDPNELVRGLFIAGEQALKRGRQNGDTLASAAADIARAQATAALEAKTEAVLASAAANTDGGPKLSPAERIGAEWEARRRTFDDGWNV